MLNTLLFVHLIIALLLIVVILLQKTSTDGLSGIGGGNNMGVMSGRTAANFLTRITIILGIVFFVNAIVLANLSTQKYTNFATKLEQTEEKEEAEPENDEIPIAK